MAEQLKALIREIANDPGSEKPPKRQRAGGGAMVISTGKETPRRLINQIANFSTASTAQDAKGSAKARARGRPKSSTDSQTPKDPRDAIGRFLRVAETDSREKKRSPSKNDIEYEAGFTSEYESDEEEIVDDDDKALPGASDILQIVGRQRRHAKKTGTVIKRRMEARRTGEIPFLKTTNVFKSLLGEFPRPNRPTATALEEAHASLLSYLDRSIRDYARLARIDDVAPHNLTRDRVEQLLREQGLLVRPLGDEIRRLLDRDDADAALGLPMSRARASRM